MQHARAHTRTRSGIARHAVARRHIRVGSVVDIQQGPLSAFKQQVGAFEVRLVELTRHVGHHGLEQLGVAHGFVKYSLKLHLSVRHVGCQRGAEIKRGRAQVRGQNMVM